jgi:hypothetical protein
VKIGGLSHFRKRARVEVGWQLSHSKVNSGMVSQVTEVARLDMCIFFSSVALEFSLAYKTTSTNYHLMLVMYFTMISHHLHSSDHRPDGKEPQYFSENDADGDQLFSIDVADAAENAFRCCGASCGASAGHDRTRVSHGVDQGLEV